MPHAKQAYLDHQNKLTDPPDNSQLNGLRFCWKKLEMSGTARAAIQNYG